MKHVLIVLGNTARLLAIRGGTQAARRPALDQVRIGAADYRLASTSASIGSGTDGRNLGVDFAGSNTAREDFDLPPMSPGDIYTVDFHLSLPELYPSHFSFSPAIANGSLRGYEMCDWIDNALTVQMGHSEGEIYGYIRFPCRVELCSD